MARKDILERMADLCEERGNQIESLKLQIQKLLEEPTARTLTMEELENCLSSSVSIEASLEEKELISIIEDFLRGLSQENRVIFLRRYWYAESVREVAEACGVSESKVKMSLHRTRKKLREFLQKERLWQ